MIRTKEMVLLVLCLGVLVFAVSCSSPKSQPTQPGGRFGVSPLFLSFYEAKGGLAFFGYAISEERPENGVSVQYFQRARLEYRPDLPAGQQVRLSNLLKDDRDHGLNLSDAKCVDPRFVPSGAWLLGDCHAIQPDFLTYYLQLDGVNLLGLPISEAYTANGVTMQNFENGSIVFDPTQPPTSRFRLGDTGNIVLIKKPLPLRGTNFAPPIKVTDVKVIAWVQDPVLVDGRNQKIYVLVTDQIGRPLRDAIVDVTLTIDGGTVRFRAVPTDKQGMTVLEIPAKEMNSRNIITYTVTAVYVITKADGNSEPLSDTDKGQFVPWRNKP